jgi:hypothetical protein
MNLLWRVKQQELPISRLFLSPATGLSEILVRAIAASLRKLAPSR